MLPSFEGIKLKEWDIYGSEAQGRIAVHEPIAGEQVLYQNAFITRPEPQQRVISGKGYELKDHLGNVRVVVSDVKEPVDPNTRTQFFTHYKEISDYYPFGMLMEGRNWQSYNERYSYNGMEQDDYLKENNQYLTTNPLFARTGTGNSYTTEFRELDTRIGRWWSRDPKPTIFESRYAAMGNNPVMKIDLFGDSASVINGDNNFEIYGPVINSNEFNPKELEQQLNSFIGQWKDPTNRHYAPNISEFLKEEKVNTVLMKIAAAGSCYQDGTIAISEDIYRADQNMLTMQSEISRPSLYLEAVFFHEIVHKKIDKENDTYGTEFQAYAASFSAGYVSKGFIINKANKNPNYFTDGMPDNFNKYFNIGTNDRPISLIKSTTSNFLIELYNYGKLITGQKK